MSKRKDNARTLTLLPERAVRHKSKRADSQDTIDMLARFSREWLEYPQTVDRGAVALDFGRVSLVAIEVVGSHFYRQKGATKPGAEAHWQLDDILPKDRGVNEQRFPWLRSSRSMFH